WQTQNYYSETLNKAGVGLYVDARPGTTARELRIVTPTPGFTATVYARTNQPPLTWPDAGWVKISASTRIGSTQAIRLTSDSTKYRYYLLWITDLGAHSQLSIGEMTLYK